MHIGKNPLFLASGGLYDIKALPCSENACEETQRQLEALKLPLVITFDVEPYLQTIPEVPFTESDCYE